MKILVTGGCGFVGRHLVKKGFSLNYDVTVVDDLSTGKHPVEWTGKVSLTADELRRLDFHHLDVRHYFNGLTRASDFDLVFHCAAVVGGRLTIEGQPLYVATDLSIDAEFFNWCMASPPRRVVYFSSSAVYPVKLQSESMHVTLSESLVTFEVSRIGMPDATYGWSKLTGEYLMHHAVKAGLDCICYRPFSGYGEDQDFTYPFPSIIRRVGRRDDPIEIWGSGDQVRDFIHIDDIVNAIFASVGQLKPGAVLNLGTGEGISFKSLVKVARKVLNHSASIKTVVTKPMGVFSRVADVYEMHKYWMPEVSLEDGIARVYDYQARQGFLTPETETA